MNGRGSPDWGGNYPPGAKNDPRAPYNQPDRSHEHEWRPFDEDPIIEDGAAIFQQECQYAEGRYGEGWQCEETRSYRFELAWVKKKSIGTIYLESELDYFPMVAEEGLIAVHQDGEIIAMDPDEDNGYVTVETDEWRVKFKANRQPQIDPRPR